jgi:hypothetical protein
VALCFLGIDALPHINRIHFAALVGHVLWKWGHIGPYCLQLRCCTFLFLVMLIVFHLLSWSRHCLVHFHPVDYCSLLTIVLKCYCFDCRYCSPLFGGTIACTSISRASAGSLYPSFGFNINLLSSLSLSLILLLLTLLVALIRHIGAWWCAITSVTVVPCGQLIGRSTTFFLILFDFFFCTILTSPFLVYMWLCLIVARLF